MSKYRPIAQKSSGCPFFQPAPTSIEQDNAKFAIVVVGAIDDTVYFGAVLV